MRLLAVGLMATVSAVAASQGALADPLVGPYIAIGGGANFPPDIRSGTPADLVSQKTGFVGNFGVGYSLGNGLRPEFELGYLQSDLDTATGYGGKALKGSVAKWTYTFNVFYDLDTLHWPVTPYVGVGAGGASVHGGDITAGTPGFEVSGSRFAAQGILGLSYPLSPAIKLNVDYRYLETFNAKFTAQSAAGAVSGSNGDVGDNSLLVSLRYTFAPPPPPPPAPAAPPPAIVPAAAPPAPEAQRAFQVFFDFDKSDITDAAAAVIQKAADEVNSGHIASIAVTGHTDTVGTVKYNLKLSERRAAAVKKQLLADGVSGAEISTVGVGKSGLLVPTPDGTREPQNRRAEIVLK